MIPIWKWCGMFLCAVSVAPLVCCAAMSPQEALLRQADAWKKGTPVPAGLLEYRDATQDGGCFHIDDDTVPLFSEIDNYPLLLELIFFPNVDSRIFDCALLRALHLAGPTRFFSNVKARHRLSPGLARDDRQKNLARASELKHVVAEGIFIRKDAMSAAKADCAFAEVMEDLKRGDSWEAIFKKYVCDCSRTVSFPSPFMPKSAPEPEKHKAFVSSCMGNYGDFILSRENTSDRPLRRADVHEEHMYPLLQAKAGDLLLLDDNAGERRILYHVREVYIP